MQVKGLLVPVGKASFTEEQLADNFQTLIDAIVKAKPAAAKGQYFRNVTITSTMGPGVKNFGTEPENTLLSAEKVAIATIQSLVSEFTGQVIDVKRNEV